MNSAELAGPADSLSNPEHLRATLVRATFALAKRGDADAVAMCLDAGIPADVVNADGNSLLGIALHHWKYPVATLLIDRGVNVQQSYEGDPRFIEKAILGNRRYVEERCPELIAAYERALLSAEANGPSAGERLQRVAPVGR